MRNSGFKLAVFSFILAGTVLSAGAAYAQLALPYHGTGSSPTNALFWLTQTGAANAGRFEITSSTNSKGALVGITQGTGYGVYGLTYRGTQAIYGESRATNGIGVYGISNTGTTAKGVYGSSSAGTGVYGTTNGSGYGVCALSTSSGPALSVVSTGLGRAAIFEVRNPSNTAYAVNVLSAGSGPAVDVVNTGMGNGGAFRLTNPSTNQIALSASNAGSGYSLFVLSAGTGMAGRFHIGNTSSSATAVYVSTDGTGRAGYFTIQNAASSADALYAGTLGTGRAGYFHGKVYVSGLLEKAGGGFKIDHPLDPETKYLNHSFVESPDRKNVYDGVANLDSRGEAWVQLPDWFEALNRDFRYQLTAVGAAMPNLHIAVKLADNRFKIAGGSSGGEVSWQVTGARQDAWANANEMPVEEEKPDAERGSYLHPKAFGQPETLSVESALNMR